MLKTDKACGSIQLSSKIKSPEVEEAEGRRRD